MLQVIESGNMSISHCGESSNNTTGLQGQRPLHIKHPAAVLIVWKMCLERRLCSFYSKELTPNWTINVIKVDCLDPH